MENVANIICCWSLGQIKASNAAIQVTCTRTVARVRAASPSLAILRADLCTDLALNMIGDQQINFLWICMTSRHCRGEARRQWKQMILGMRGRADCSWVMEKNGFASSIC